MDMPYCVCVCACVCVVVVVVAVAIRDVSLGGNVSRAIIDEGDEHGILPPIQVRPALYMPWGVCAGLWQMGVCMLSQIVALKVFKFCGKCH